MTQASTKVTLQAAFVLHHRPFRDTSIIADLLTPDHGRIGVIARGARSAKSTRRVLLQPFRPLLASWTGRSELKTLTTLEESGLQLHLANEALACAYYLSELALRLVPPGESNVVAFALYARSLQQLAEQPTEQHELTLRLYELELLECLGLLPDFANACVRTDTSDEIPKAGRMYYFNAETATAASQKPVFDAVAVSGETLLALSSRQLQGESVMREAKRVMRSVLSLHLGNQPLRSREVFRQMRGSTHGDHQ